MDSDNDIINIDDAPSLQDELERLQNSEEFTGKILKVFEHGRRIFRDFSDVSSIRRSYLFYRSL